MARRRFKALAAGNRFIFLEIGTAIAEFIVTFQGTCATGPDAEARWTKYWDDTALQLEEIKHLDPSWVPTNPGNPDQLRAGLHQYFLAIGETDKDVKSERILAGNILLGAYEQYRADGYILTSFAIRGDRAFHRLLVRGTGRSRNPIRFALTSVYTALMTRHGLVLIAPHEIVRVGQALKAPMQPNGERRDAIFSKDVMDLGLPLVQALVSRYDLSDFRSTKRGAKNWIHYYERMHFITNLFRSRHDEASLWTVPLFDPADRDELLAGRLPASSSFPVHTTRRPGSATLD